MRPCLWVCFGAMVLCCTSQKKPPPPREEALGRVATIHGEAGPWAVAGYRMGIYALAKLGLPRQSFDLEVVHRTPALVQYSCIADGVAAATGASIGKLNLKLVDADPSQVSTLFRNRATGQTLALRPSAPFISRFKDLKPESLRAAGVEVLDLPDTAVFEEVATGGR